MEKYLEIAKKDGKDFMLQFAVTAVVIGLLALFAYFAQPK